MHHKRAHRADEHGDVGCQARITVYDVEKLFRTKIGSKPTFGHYIIAQL